MSGDDRPRSGLQPVSRILADALERFGLHERLEERAALLRWREVVGDDIAEHSRAVDIQEGVLIIEADHGVWRQEVTMLIPMIIEKFNAMCGENTVNEIQWRYRRTTGRKQNRKS